MITNKSDKDYGFKSQNTWKPQGPNFICRQIISLSLTIFLTFQKRTHNKTYLVGFVMIKGNISEIYSVLSLK